MAKKGNRVQVILECTVVTGRIEQGIVNVNEEVEIVGIRETSKSVCTGVEMFRKLLDEGFTGDNTSKLLGMIAKGLSVAES